VSEILTKYWYAIVGGIVFVLCVWFLVRKGGTDERAPIGGYFIFGSLWPVINSYFLRRGRINSREMIGWGVVIALMILAAIFMPGRPQ